MRVDLIIINQTKTYVKTTIFDIIYCWLLSQTKYIEFSAPIWSAINSNTC